ncbi:Chromate transport protein ChrA [Roseibacterium elongatum DSM 19469]|uniref:Chromate transport protein ChrA n=1 Tax=Roseicyclus elongatus DSM 19469 TaxID=1294273 RepID=W8RTA2_9RHOB|nr:chromate efflux transporter [Roseibacterium elongatum]AHM04419.1 Chromate transport protein ChrA [Roseibacterium elongatum DSM 19469]
METPAPTLSDITRVFGRIGLLSFGGPAAQIALMHRELVEDRPWLSEKQFLNALSFCMLLPGPEAMQLATYAGWRLQGPLGGLIAGLLFVIPGAVVIFALAALYAAYGDIPVAEALFLGIKAAVIVIVAQALWRVSKKALHAPLAWGLAIAAFLGLSAFALPFPVIVLGAGLIGALSARPGAGTPAHAVPLSRTLRTVLLWGAIWLLPLAALWLVAPGGTLAEIGLFFAKLAVVTFGGAYAVLAWMVQEVVQTHGWLTTAQMMDALGLAETTPGPLILVTQFVGFLAGAFEGGTILGVAAALVTLWVTFAPCFLWIFAGAPYVEWIATQPRLTGALSAITAAVVGVIANLSLWFALHVLFSEVAQVSIGPMQLWLPDTASWQPGALILTALAALLILWRKLDLIVALPLMALAGLGWGLANGLL